ncbi:MAG: hypothetical protein HYV07_22970 [Deltaproteobacteria bacterium]|nr:hypothetical protein [Deltaproteobacteria bacterium]
MIKHAATGILAATAGCSASTFEWFSIPGDGSHKGEILAIGDGGRLGLCAVDTTRDEPFSITTPPTSTTLYSLRYSESLDEMGLDSGIFHKVPRDGRALPEATATFAAEFDGYDVLDWAPLERGTAFDALRSISIHDPECPEIVVCVVDAGIDEYPYFLSDLGARGAVLGTGKSVWVVDAELEGAAWAWCPEREGRLDGSTFVRRLPLSDGSGTAAYSILALEDGTHWLGGERLRRVRIGEASIEVIESIPLPATGDLASAIAVRDGVTYALTYKGLLGRLDGDAVTTAFDFAALEPSSWESGQLVVFGPDDRLYASRHGIFVELVDGVGRPIIGIQEVVGFNRVGDELIAATRAGDLFLRTWDSEAWTKVGRTRAEGDDAGPDASHLYPTANGFVATGNGGVGFFVRRRPEWTKCQPSPAQATSIVARAQGWLTTGKPRVCDNPDLCFSLPVFFRTVPKPEPLWSGPPGSEPLCGTAALE